MESLTFLLSLLCLVLFVTASTKAVDESYCNTQMNTGNISLPLPKAKLTQVQTFIRHGARVRWSPQQCWPEESTTYHCGLQIMLGTDTPGSMLFRKKYSGDKGAEKLPGSCNLGQLTHAGYQMEQRSGELLRRAYAELLPASLNSSSAARFHLRSDDQPRTLQSGQALFSGMYPGARADDNSGPFVMDWYTQDSGWSDTIPGSSPEVCPTLANATAAVQSSAAYKNHLKKTTDPLIQQLTPVVSEGMFDNPDGWDVILDCIYSHVCSTVPSVPSGAGAIPSSFTATLQQQAVDEATWKNYAVMGDPLVRKLMAGPLLQQVVQAADLALSKPSEAHDFVLYSGHDTGPLMPMLAALDIGDGLWSRFAALLAIELYEQAPTDSGTAIRIVYNGEVQHISGCSDSAGLCDWKAFRSIAMALVPSTTECGRALN